MDEKIVYKAKFGVLDSAWTLSKTLSDARSDDDAVIKAKAIFVELKHNGTLPNKAFLHSISKNGKIIAL